MKTFRTKITISEDKTLTIKELPFPAGDKVEVVVRSSKRRKKRGERYPLRGKPIWYIDPFKRRLFGVTLKGCPRMQIFFI